MGVKEFVDPIDMIFQVETLIEKKKGLAATSLCRTYSSNFDFPRKRLENNVPRMDVLMIYIIPHLAGEDNSVKGTRCPQKKHWQPAPMRNSNRC